MRTVLPMSARAKIVAVLGFGTLILAVILASTEVDANGESCGNMLVPRSVDGFSECSRAMSQRRYEVIILIAIAAGLMLPGVIARVSRSSRPPAVRAASYPRQVPTCPGSRILHVDGTPAGCTADVERDRCAGRDRLHQGDPVTCFVWSTHGGCEHCGVQAVTQNAVRRSD